MSEYHYTGPTPYPADRFSFGTDEAGNPIVFRPNELIVWLGADDRAGEREVPDVRAIAQNLYEAGLLPRPNPKVPASYGKCEAGTGESRGKGERVRPAIPAVVQVQKRLGRGWAVLAVSPDAGSFDAARAGRFLRSQGIPAQVNHVYFVDSLSRRGQPALGGGATGSAPYTLNPNMFSPNMFSPNMFSPNMFSPNMFSPNMFSPNMFSGAGAAGTDCCCNGGVTRFDENFIPKLNARPADNPATRPLPPGRLPLRPLPPPALHKGIDIKIHVLDVRDPILSGVRSANSEVFADAANAAGESGYPEEMVTRLGKCAAVLLQVFSRFVKRVRGQGVQAAEILEGLQELELEPTSTGLGVNANADNCIDPVTGHGSFIASIIKRMVGGLDGEIVIRENIAGTLGDVDDADLADALDAIRVRDDEDGTKTDRSLRILNLSLSGYTEDDRPSLVLANAIDALQTRGWLIVASAGNQASCRISWPAALEGVISVAAVGPHGPAWFSSFGPWVDACAPGVDIVSEFPELDPSLDGLEGSDGIVGSDFRDKWATWSGTSFASPVVAAQLAVHMIRHFNSGASREELYGAALYDTIIDPSLLRIPNYGTVVNAV